MRLLHTYQLLARLRQDSNWFRRHEDVVLAVVNLFVFLFVMSGIVYASQYGRNPGINNYVDALYFTVTALTTTGFGDITLARYIWALHLHRHHDPRRHAVLDARPRAAAADTRSASAARPAR